jgi:hypothetical protein
MAAGYEQAGYSVGVSEVDKDVELRKLVSWAKFQAEPLLSFSGNS